MLYLILLLIIFFLLYKEYKYNKEAEALIHAYLYFLKISYVNDTKKTISNLQLYEALISNELDAKEYDLIFKTLAKSWKVRYYKSDFGSFADGEKIVEELVSKIDSTTKSENYKNLVEKAKYSLDQE